MMYAPEGNETITWNDLRVSKVILDHNQELMTDLILQFSNSNFLTGHTRDSIESSQK